MTDNPDDIRSLSASWRRHLDAANLAARTIETCSGAGTQLTVYLSAEEHSLRCPEIGREDLEGFNVDQRLTHSASTASNRHRALQQFFLWLLLDRYCLRSVLDIRRSVDASGAISKDTEPQQEALLAIIPIQRTLSTEPHENRRLAKGWLDQS